MTDGLMLPDGAGRLIPSAGMTLKVGAERTARWSMFEAVVQPGFDVGAHLHHAAEELFYVLEGELDLLAFQPAAPPGERGGDWRTWAAEDGTTVLRGGAGSSMFVPAGCPHAFANPTESPAKLLFIVTPAGHEEYLRGIGEIVGRGGVPDQEAIREWRRRNDIEQLTPLTQRAVGPRG
ncbi:cupin domain-containing protein [Catellatospora sp. KI3]|uniref:cupin domain-containing protein n=1 Tax=Catellatospora sp. KI3 TaxID=3041620 RepID=UPI00248280DA|nr:cupin domain-containing protein [Catellatospora sp. KI3]MDI1466060.1 cupin domain-containing protein [Catellatospora sp. KI3]